MDGDDAVCIRSTRLHQGLQNVKLVDFGSHSSLIFSLLANNIVL